MYEEQNILLWEIPLRYTYNVFFFSKEQIFSCTPTGISIQNKSGARMWILSPRNDGKIDQKYKSFFSSW